MTVSAENLEVLRGVVPSISVDVVNVHLVRDFGNESASAAPRLVEFQFRIDLATTTGARRIPTNRALISPTWRAIF
jgi:hypothetical protein